MPFLPRPVRGILALIVATALVLPAHGAFGGSAGPQAIAAYDGFDRADGVGLGTSDTGQEWTTHAGTASIVSGAAVLGAGYGLASLDAGASAGRVSVTMPSVGAEFWLVVRLSDATNYWRFGRQAGGGGQYVLQQVVGNSLGSPSLDVLASVSPQAGDVVGCELTSSAMTCSVDGVPVVSTADAFNRTATRHGLAAFDSPEATFDQFTVIDEAPLAALDHPSVVEQGETFTLSGDGCFGDVIGGLEGPDTGWADVELTDVSGSWSVELTVPADNPIGEFDWDVVCVLASQSYPASTIEIVEPPAQPTSSTTSIPDDGPTDTTDETPTTTVAGRRATSTTAPARAAAQSPSFTG